MANNTLSVLALIALLLIGVAIVVEKKENQTWNNRLAWPDFIDAENKHTPIFPLGTFIPPRIEKDTTYIYSDSPVLLTDNTVIAPGATLTFETGTLVMAHEHASFIIEGTLKANGVLDHEVVFTTNEEYPDNQTWNGFIVQPSGTANLSYTKIQFASPGITCEQNGKADMKHLTIEGASIGFFTKSNLCRMSDSVLRRVRDGIISIGTQPSIQNVSISASHEEQHTY